MSSRTIHIAIALTLLTLLIQESLSVYYFVGSKEEIAMHREDFRATVDSAEKLKQNALKMGAVYKRIWTDAALQINHDLQAKFTGVFYPTRISTNDSTSEPLDSQTIKELNTIAELCGKDDLFMDQEANHMEAQSKLMKIFRAKIKTEDLLNFATRLRHHPKLNYKLWLKGFVSVSVERRELNSLKKPCLFKLIPGSFVNTARLIPPLKEVSITNSTNSTQTGNTTTNTTSILLPTPAIQNQTCQRMDGEWTVDNVTDMDEHKLWYFREDFLLNILHWNWHNLYTFKTLKKIDRRGEFFGYFHHHLIARYHAERLSNGLSPALPIDLRNETIIKEGYNPHLGEIENSTKIFGLRDPNRVLNGTNIFIKYKTVIEKDIDDMAFIKLDGTKVSTLNTSAVDVFGNLLEASSHFSINADRYLKKGLHNLGHVEISRLSINKKGVMGATETALRDPVFYRWHVFIDSLFQRMKASLPPYEPEQGELSLSWSDVTIEEFIVQTECTKDHQALRNNELYTFFKNVTVSFNLTASFDDSDEPIKYCIITLDHKPFEYKFVINSDETHRKRATIRVFMAPRFDEEGERYNMKEQRKLFFSMDEILVELKPGLNRIKRRSNESLLTVKSKYDDSSSSYTTLPQCDCGWPAHLLLPKGTEEGMIFDLFAMITHDKADVAKANANGTLPPVCVASHILCGKNGENYPDSRPMGYPFDRRPFKVRKGGRRQKTVADLDEFVEPNSNMKTVQVKIIHSSVTDMNQILKENTDDSGKGYFDYIRTD